MSNSPKTISLGKAKPLFGAAALPLCLGLMTLAAAPPASHAEPPVAGSRSYHIAPQPLYAALSRLAEQSGVQFVYDSALVKGLNSLGVNGNYSLTGALVQLLAGSGITYQLGNGNTVTLEKADAASDNPPEPQSATTLPKVKVTGKAEYADDDPYNIEYARAHATSATKTDTPLMETPMSIQVVPRAVMDDQQAVEVKNIVRNVSGVQRSASSGDEGGLYDNFVIRGFDTQAQGIFRNGIKQAAWSSEVANLERVEVLKGPAAILYGRLEPGGMINLVTKKPQRDSYYSLQQQLGSYDLYRTTLDATGAVTKDDSLLYRLNVAYLDKNSFRDFNGKERIMVAPSWTWNVSDRTQINLNLEYQNDDIHGADAIPAFTTVHFFTKTILFKY